MEFSEKELILIKKASVKMRQVSISRTISFGVLLLSLVAMLFGYLDEKVFAYLSFIIVIVSIAQPQLGTGPKYEELVGLLASKCLSKDPAIEILASKYKSKI